MSYYTVLKFHDFSITQILREINFRDSKSAKCTISTQLAALNFDFFFFKFYTLTIPKISKTAVLELLEPLRLISRKI